MERITKLTNEEWVQLFNEYKTTGSDDAYTDLYMALLPIAKGLGKSQYFKYKYIGVTAQDFINEAEYAIYKTVKYYDPERGSLPALLKTVVTQTIIDNLVRRHQTSSNLMSNYVSLNEEGGIAQADKHQFEKADQSVDGLLRPEKERTFVTKIEQLVQDFSKVSSEDDGNIVKTIFSLVMNEAESRAKFVNKSLETIFPGVSTATLRKKKQRALTRFTAFAKENGFDSVNVSQL